jgi:hypothetical protein
MNYILSVKYIQPPNSYLCNQLGNALFCVMNAMFPGRPK